MSLLLLAKLIGHKIILKSFWYTIVELEEKQKKLPE